MRVTPCLPRRRIIALIIIWLVLTCACPAAAGGLSDTHQETWMALFVNGQKSGFLHNIRETDKDTVKTTQRMHWQLQRGGVPLQIEMTEISRETLSGQPVSFHSRQRLSGIAREISGVLDGEGQLKITRSGAGSKETATLQWHEDWVMPEGYRLRQLKYFRQAGMKPGTQFSAWVFVPSMEKAVKTVSTLGPLEEVDLLGHSQKLYHVKEVADFGFMQQVSEAWLDADFHVKKMRTVMMGMTLEMIVCPQACATADNTPFEAFSTIAIGLPRHLDQRTLRRPIRWTFRLKQPIDNLRLINNQEQRSHLVTDKNGTQKLIVTVYPRPETAMTGPVRLEAPEPDELKRLKQPTSWMQSQASLIVELAEKNVHPGHSDKQKMESLTHFVRHYITDKSLSVAYASALETARHRNGDCTEHALLTGALGRAAGIPTRIVTGLAYVPEFNGRKNVLVPHAWTQAWINSRWHSFDAALGQFDSAHIALAHGSGDPFDFYSSIQLLGNLAVESIEPLPDHWQALKPNQLPEQ